MQTETPPVQLYWLLLWSTISRHSPRRKHTSRWACEKQSNVEHCKIFNVSICPKQSETPENHQKQAGKPPDNQKKKQENIRKLTLPVRFGREWNRCSCHGFGARVRQRGGEIREDLERDRCPAPGSARWWEVNWEVFLAFEGKKHGSKQIGDLLKKGEHLQSRPGWCTHSRLKSPAIRWRCIWDSLKISEVKFSKGRFICVWFFAFSLENDRGLTKNDTPWIMVMFNSLSRLCFSASGIYL